MAQRASAWRASGVECVEGVHGVGAWRGSGGGVC